MDPLDVDRHREALVDVLTRKGALVSDEWIQAFRRVPRHLFVPRYWRWAPSGGRQLLDSSRPEQRAAWLAGAYSAESLLVQLEDETATSSSTAPELIAIMLEALQVQDGNRVLEIGTGTGYNAALLCSRLGSERVTTIDVDADLVHAARARLAEAGFAPTVVATDGIAGYQPNARYDRLIATCGVSFIPPAWIRQVSTGGSIVAPLLGGIARLETTGDGTAHGHFLQVPAYFMPMRGEERKRTSTEEMIALASGPGAAQATVIPGEIEDELFMFFLDLVIPGAELFAKGRRLQAPRLVDPADGSWARVDPAPDGGHVVVQGGPQRLWDRLQAAHRLWLKMGRPERDRYVVTVEADGTQWVGYEEAGERHSWMLPR